MEDNKVIFSMDRVGKIYPGNKQVLRDISLGYFYGAKIGVLGLNGSGKSTLLKIMAGVEKDYVGRISMSKGYTVGYLEQEPEFDGEKTVQDVVEEAVIEIVDLLRKYDDINNKFSEPMSDDEMNKLLEEQGNLQDKLDATNAWDLDSRLDMAMNALRCPPSDMKIKYISGGEKRRVALCKLLLQEPDILLLDEPTIGLDIAFKREFYNTILGEYFNENKLILISTHQIEEIEFLLHEIIFLHEGKLILHKDIEELKSEYNIVSLPSERGGELDSYKPLYKTKSFGMVSGLLNADVLIEGATYSKPQIAEIFLAMTGGYDATV